MLATGLEERPEHEDSRHPRTRTVSTPLGPDEPPGGGIQA